MAVISAFANRERPRNSAEADAADLPLEGVEEWSAKRTESQLLGFPNDESRQGREGCCPADPVANLDCAVSLGSAGTPDRLRAAVRIPQPFKDGIANHYATTASLPCSAV